MRATVLAMLCETKCDAILNFLNVNTCDQPLKVEADTGAKVSVIPASIFSPYTQWNGLILNKSEMRLSTYMSNGSSLPVLGEAEVTVTCSNQFATDKIVAVQGGNHALLGRNWLLKLKLDWNSLFSSVNAIHSNESQPAVFFLPCILCVHVHKLRAAVLKKKGICKLHACLIW